jgi:anthrone oxygenase-like protein
MRPGTHVGILRSASQLCCGILVGVALTVLALELALRRLDGPAYVLVRHAEYDYFTWFVGAVFAPTPIAVAMLVVSAYRARSPLLRPALLALGLLLLAVVVTLMVNGPINIEQLGWDTQAPPADWAHVRDRWQVAHAVRTLALVLALGSLSQRWANGVGKAPPTPCPATEPSAHRR